MTRKQAFLILLLALLALAGRQHIQWPSRFWESPSFQVVDWEVLFRTLASAQENNDEATVTVAPSVAEESPAETKKPAEEPQKAEKPKVASKRPAKAKKKVVAKATPPPPTSATPDPPTAPALKIPLGKFPYDVVERISSCWDVLCSERYYPKGTILVQYTNNSEGLLQNVTVVADTLKVPAMTRCVIGTIDSGGIRLEEYDPKEAGKNLFETRIVFEHGRKPA